MDFEDLFLGRDDVCCKSYLEKLVRFFKRIYHKKRHDCIFAYIAGKGRSGGPKRRLNDADDSLIEAIIKEDDSLTDNEIARLFGLRRCGDENFAGTTLVRRARLRREIVALVYDRTHIAASKASQELHYRICASVHEDRFINFDEVATALKPMFAPFPRPLCSLSPPVVHLPQRSLRRTKAKTRPARRRARARKASAYPSAS